MSGFFTDLKGDHYESKIFQRCSKSFDVSMSDLLAAVLSCFVTYKRRVIKNACVG